MQGHLPHSNHPLNVIRQPKLLSALVVLIKFTAKGRMDLAHGPCSASAPLRPFRVFAEKRGLVSSHRHRNEEDTKTLMAYLFDRGTLEAKSSAEPPPPHWR